jgi:ABC-type metal ion transport system substrate-binding protein
MDAALTVQTLDDVDAAAVNTIYATETVVLTKFKGAELPSW